MPRRLLPLNHSGCCLDHFRQVVGFWQALKVSQQSQRPSATKPNVSVSAQGHTRKPFTLYPHASSHASAQFADIVIEFVLLDMVIKHYWLLIYFWPTIHYNILRE